MKIECLTRGPPDPAPPCEWVLTPKKCQKVKTTKYVFDKSLKVYLSSITPPAGPAKKKKGKKCFAS